MMTDTKQQEAFYAVLAVPRDELCNEAEETTRKRIIVVDDDADTCRLVRRMIESGGKYKVLTCTNALVALPIIAICRPMLIVLDLNMPLMNGYDALRKLKSNPRTCHIPVIVLTAQDEDMSMIQTIRSYADAFLTKPCCRNELLAAVNRSLSARGNF